MRATVLTAAATAVALSVGISGCSSSSSKGGGGSSKSNASYNAANTSVVNASSKTGGTVTYEDSDVPDSLDPGNTYYAFVQDFSRLYGRSLTTFKPAPGKDGLTLVPDLAASLGKPSADGKTWTYTLRKGVKFSDGTTITSKDVKYAIERSNFAPEALSNGPTYFKALLVGGDTYKGPYKDKSATGLKSIETPNDSTIVFHLKQAFADFDYLTSFSQTMPVPQAKDKGADYVKNMVSSGPYKFQSYQDGKQAVLVKNPYWSSSTDPIRKQYADKIIVNFKVSQTTIDNNLIAGNTTLDIAGAGVAPATQPQLLTKPSLHKNADDAISGALAYTAINTKVAPFNNIDCRKAVEYAIDKTSVQTAIGGPVRGDIAHTVLPPSVAGYTNYADLYPSTGNAGNVTQAKAELAKCGQPNGFSTNISARSDRPAEIAAATAIQAALKKVGITVAIQQYPSGKYFSDNAGSTDFVHQHKLGLMMMAWAADWPTGYGFLQQIVDGGAIKASGNSNLSELNDPKVNSALSAAISNTDSASRLAAWGTIDKQVMSDAVIVPLVYRKDLLYRPDNATNVMVTPAYGMYDYLLVGSTK
ncbi:ABC transporter substrate-binding protein [Actinacidiphila oryziradicis]|nr:ABC transporter substrate-binding protein [Actinacidiphila oryziradicis]